MSQGTHVRCRGCWSGTRIQQADGNYGTCPRCLQPITNARIVRPAKVTPRVDRALARKAKLVVKFGALSVRELQIADTGFQLGWHTGYQKAYRISSPLRSQTR